MSASTKEIVDYVFTGTNLCLECSGDFAPGFLIVEIVVLLIGCGVSIFDTITDWNIVFQFRDKGLQNPLLPIDNSWLHALYIFTVIGTILTATTIFHESLNVLHSLWHTCKRCCCKSGKHYKILEGTQRMEMPSKNEDNKGTPTVSQKDGSAEDNRDHLYHLYQDGNVNGKERNKEDISNKNENGTDSNTDSEDDEAIHDACKCCYHFG